MTDLDIAATADPVNPLLRIKQLEEELLAEVKKKQDLIAAARVYLMSFAPVAHFSHQELARRALNCEIER